MFVLFIFCVSKFCRGEKNEKKQLMLFNSLNNVNYINYCKFDEYYFLVLRIPQGSEGMQY